MYVNSAAFHRLTERLNRVRAKLGQFVKRGTAKELAILIESDIVRKKPPVFILRVTHCAKLDEKKYLVTKEKRL